jgi:hypothetical protein
MIINVLIKNVSNDIEKKLIKLINFKPPQCYNEVSESELQKFKNMQDIINNVDVDVNNVDIDINNVDIDINNVDVDINNVDINNVDEVKNVDYVNKVNKELFISLRNSSIRYKMIIRHGILIKNTKKMVKDYNNKVDILTISKKYDGSPLNILRIIYKNIYPNLSFKTLVNDNNYNKLNEEDKKQFIKANENDKFAVINHDKMHEESLLFEKEIEKILIKNNIKYKTQEMLCKEQIKEHDKCISTPDFLILSKFVVNNTKIKWIDAKNFYGANNKFIINSIKKQTEKYVRLYGNGIIIFKLGCNEKLVFDNIICTSYNQFSTI